MEKRTVYMKVSVHWIKAQIMAGIYSKYIDLSKDSYRVIASKIGLENESPQKIKHHLDALVSMGTLDKSEGQYKYTGVDASKFK